MIATLAIKKKRKEKKRKEKKPLNWLNELTLNQPTLSIYTFEEGNNEINNVGWFGCTKKKT